MGEGGRVSVQELPLNASPAVAVAASPGSLGWGAAVEAPLTFLRLQVPLCPRMAASRAERSLSASV